MTGRRSGVQYGMALLKRFCVSVFSLFEGMGTEDDLLVGRVCLRSRGELSAGPLSQLRSALVSYPESRGDRK